MDITELKAKKVMAGPGVFVYIAEAKVEDSASAVYVTVQYYDGELYSVADKSVYAFLDGDGTDQANELHEEYDSAQGASESRYAEIFWELRRILEKLG